MSDLTKLESLNELARFDPLFSGFPSQLNVDDMFNRFMMRPVFHGDIKPQIKMDVKEADGKHLVNAKIPGVNKDDIHASVEGNRVPISAEVKMKKEVEEGDRVVHSERSVATRSYTPGSEMD